MKQATYRIIFFPAVKRYIGMAWNYEQAVLISTKDLESYTDARAALVVSAGECGVELKWFDGEYTVDNDGQLVPRPPSECVGR